MSVRQIDTCVVCGDPRAEIVSRGRCAKCVMRERREAERRGEPVHNPGEYNVFAGAERLSQAVYDNGGAAAENGPIPDTFISPEDHNTLRRIIRQSIDKIQTAKRSTEHGAAEIVLGPPPDDEGPGENGEQLTR